MDFQNIRKPFLRKYKFFNSGARNFHFPKYKIKEELSQSGFSKYKKNFFEKM